MELASSVKGKERMLMIESDDFVPYAESGVLRLLRLP